MMLCLCRRLFKIHNLSCELKFAQAGKVLAEHCISGAISAPAVMSRESHRWSFFHQILGLSVSNNPSPRYVSSSGTSQSSEDADRCYFNSADESGPNRRPSTIDDEVKVIALLKEIIAYQDTNVSNWIIEGKVKSLCAAYMYLLKPHKEGFLKALACDFAVDHTAVQKAAQQISVLQQEEYSSRQIVKLEEKLKNLLTPQYSWLFVHVGRLERGVKFLVDLRTDVLSLISQLDSSDPAMVPMQRLNTTLRDLLSLWFSVGFLTLERVTWKSPCEMLQKISEYEAVHPVRSWTDLKRRVGLYRRCFVYTHNSMPDEPLVVLHTALCDEISSSMAGIVASASRLSVDSSTSELGFVGVQSETENPALIKAAVFYSITSTQKGLQGIELGNYLIKRVAQEVQAEFPQVNQFSTLSPIPGFRPWLFEKLKSVAKGQNDIVSIDEDQKLQQILGKEWMRELLRILKSNSWLENAELVAFLKNPLMRLCARYLYLEKHRNNALNSVANFHLKNGSVMWRLNWQADLSARGLGNSCGMMVNYRYFLEETESNSRRYIESHFVNASEQITQLAAEAEVVSMQLTSKM